MPTDASKEELPLSQIINPKTGQYGMEFYIKGAVPHAGTNE